MIADGRLSDKHTHIHSVNTSEGFILQMFLFLVPAVVTGVRSAVTGQVSGDGSVVTGQVSGACSAVTGLVIDEGGVSGSDPRPRPWISSPLLIP